MITSRPGTPDRILKAVVLAAGLMGASGFAYAGRSSDYKHDESKNAHGPNRCFTDDECDGKRICFYDSRITGREAGYCQGKAR